MENLGSMELDKLLQLFVASLVGAALVFLLIVVYVVVSRRRDAAKRQMRLGTKLSRQEESTFKIDEIALPVDKAALTPPSPGLQGEVQSPDNSKSPIDVTARLTGTGREAWLAETTPPRLDTALVEELTAYHGREILRLVQDPLSGQVWVQIAGMRYKSLKDIRDRAVGERVLAAITHILRFSNGMVASDQGVTVIQLPPCEAVQVPTAFGVLTESFEPGEVLRLMSDAEQGRVCVYVAGRCYHRLVDIDDRVTGQSILKAISHLLQFSGGMLATNKGVEVVPIPVLQANQQTPLPPPASSLQTLPAAATVTPLPKSDPRPTTLIPDPAKVTALSEQERFLNQLMRQVPAQPEKPIQRPSLIGSLRRIGRPSSAEPLPSLNLADEINQIFQSKLAESATAANAQVETNPDGGVRIRIGVLYYNSPDEVPDPHLRDMLKRSIAEWESS